MRLKVGTEGNYNLIAKSGGSPSVYIKTDTPASIPGNDGITVKSSSNLYWDFMQTNTIQG